MKKCPACSSVYSDDSLNYCLTDGSPLYIENDPEATVVGATPTRPSATVQNTTPGQTITPHIIYATAGVVALLVVTVAVFMWNRSAAVDSGEQRQGVGSNISPAVTQSSPRNMETRELLVPATQMWFDTGISLTKGSQLSIRAFGEWSDGGVPLRFWGPNGSGDRWPGTIVPSANLDALVGKVGTNKFLVGQNYFGNSPESGTLLLSMNDTPDSFPGNKGAIRVEVSFGSH
jgi:hypothetical protein